MNIGIGTYTFPWAFGIPGQPPSENPLTHVGLVELGAELGASVVQIADNAPFDDLDGDEQKAVIETAGSVGVAVELGTRGTDPSVLRKHIELAASAGASILRSVPDRSIGLGPGEKQQSEAASDAICREVEQVLPDLERNGIILCLENYEGLPVRTIARVIERIGSPYVRVCLDTLNSLGRSEGYREVVELLAPLTGNLHIKDYTIRRAAHRLGFVVEGAPTGNGMLPVTDLLSRVPDDISAIMELWTPRQGSIEETAELELEWARTSVEYLIEKSNE